MLFSTPSRTQGIVQAIPRQALRGWRADAAAVSVRGWQPWRVAQLEHNPALEAAASPASWVKGPFLGPHFIADAAAKAAPAVVNIMVQVRSCAR